MLIDFSNSFVHDNRLAPPCYCSFYVKGTSVAWWIAIILSLFSAVGHITKGINYTEAGIAMFVFFALITTRKEYYVKTNPRIRAFGIQTALLSIGAVLIYGIVGFYFFDKKHFQIDFSILQSIKYTLLDFILVGSEDLVPRDSFASGFLYTISIGGVRLCHFLYIH